MADYCKQCSEELMSRDFGDLRHLCGPDEEALVLCAGCGSCWVDHEGKCISDDCIKEHGKKT